ncbi:MAG: hypothetical protein K9I85_07805 [Saprospiraceae bacterium]|nr:hypothetical protein [Saprospiraceae bacterium]
MVLRHLLLTGLIGLFLHPNQGGAQSTICPFSKVTSAHLVESSWQYLQTVHTSSNTVIHQGLDAFPSYLHFRFDQTAETFTSDVYAEHNWKVLQGQLYLPYQGDSVFCIQQPQADRLTLGFQTGERNESYTYVFQKVEAEATPFVRPWYELPTILVKRDKTSRSNKGKSPWWAFWRRWQKGNPPDSPPLRIQIEVTGGGYYGGLNPVYRQYVKINSEGRLIREVQTAREGLMVTRKNIDRSELEEFTVWIRDQGFFDFEREYDCTDPLCHRRKGEKPRPMPLQVLVTMGQRTKIVSVPIWGEDNQHVQYIHYPPLIDQIVETVYQMADRMDRK